MSKNTHILVIVNSEAVFGRLLLFMDNRPRTSIYVDGFNLYYGALKNAPYRWLDLSKLCSFLLPAHSINSIKYFTARVSNTKDDPRKSARQATYFRALKTIDICWIYFGHFLTHTVQMPLVSPTSKRRFATVRKTEEKGSDVNLATHLICDGYENTYDAAVLITNDSDLAEPVRIIREQLGKTVGILNPHKHPSRTLHQYATFFKSIRKGVLRQSQFPDQLRDPKGLFRKPPGW